MKRVIWQVQSRVHLFLFIVLWLWSTERGPCLTESTNILEGALTETCKSASFLISLFQECKSTEFIVHVQKLRYTGQYNCVSKRIWRKWAKPVKMNRLLLWLTTSALRCSGKRGVANGWVTAVKDGVINTWVWRAGPVRKANRRIDRRRARAANRIDGYVVVCSLPSGKAPLAEDVQNESSATSWRCARRHGTKTSQKSISRVDVLIHCERL